MNNNRKQTSSSIFNSFFSSPSPTPLPPTPQRRRFELPTPPLLMKSEPTDSFHLLPPFPSSTTSFHHPSSQIRQRTFKNVVVPTSEIARQRRARLSDKTRCLQKLIPLERQMDTATLYDQTCKYLKFLEAQIAVLQSMPLQIPNPTTTTTAQHGRYQNFNEFGRLNRQQLLQVLMSSEVAQTVMYTNGWCVFSAEQLAALFNDREQQGVAVEQRFI